ncbi:NAD(P)H-binding protein [Nocardia sp. NPDC020380]|uniref:NAD(P)H-binding protein n=1 Tax=Nocardia sp. NPDC020380 TaxID=3364309 RepID=UPI00378B595C
MREVLVLGATGTTGSRVSGFLRERGVPARLATRKPLREGDIRFDWSDPESHGPALDGISAVYLIAPIGVADPLPLVEPLLRQAIRRGVRRVVLLSSSAIPEGAPGLGELHSLVRETVPEWAVLRPSWFMQNFTGAHAVAQGVRAGEFVTATGEGRVGFVHAADIAAVAGHALIDDLPHNTDHVLTGPEALSYTDAAATIARRTGRPVRHRTLTPPEFARHLTAHGIPADFAAVLADLDDGIRTGAEDRVTDTVERVTGRPPRSFRTFVTEEFR